MPPSGAQKMAQTKRVAKIPPDESNPHGGGAVGAVGAVGTGIFDGEAVGDTVGTGVGAGVSTTLSSLLSFPDPN